MENKDFESIKKEVLKNYKTYDATKDEDNWHNEVEKVICSVVYKALNKYDSKDAVILNAGSGGESYNTIGKLIQLDIVEETIKRFKNHIVASIEDIPLENNSVDIVVCVGSVINYADFSKSMDEFSRILKPNGILIIEFERSDSGEFLFTKKHHKEQFQQIYKYNNQDHHLMMYSEKFAKKIFKKHGYKILFKRRFHILSTLLYRLRCDEEKVYKYIKYDHILKYLSYPLAHNVIFVLQKTNNHNI